MNKQLFNYGSHWSRQRFGERVQKIPVDAGFSCPNRDGQLSSSGCIYCNNASFSPFYSSARQSISEQLQVGKDFFAKRYQCRRFLAYFQSFSGTYATIEVLRKKYNEALQFPGIEGLVIATRPDCINKTTIELLQELSIKAYIRIELGVESFDDKVLAAINRCHNSQASSDALNLLRHAGIETCIHLIFGLPAESSDCATAAAKAVSCSGAALVKLHHLQIVEGSQLADSCQNGKIDLRMHTLDSYLEEVTAFIASLDPSIYIERLINRVPAEHLIAPHWGKINESQFQKLLEERLAVKGLHQGANLSKDC